MILNSNLSQQLRRRLPYRHTLAQQSGRPWHLAQQRRRALHSRSVSLMCNLHTLFVEACFVSLNAACMSVSTCKSVTGLHSVIGCLVVA